MCSNAPKPPGDDQVDDHHHDRHQREHRRERQVGLVDRVDVVTDQVGLGDQQRRVDVAERQREGEDRAGDERREGERQDHLPEGVRRLRAQVLGGGEERVRDPLEPRVDRDDHERQPEVGEHQEDPDQVVGRRDPDRAEEAAAGHDRAPDVDLHEVARPERHQDRDDQRPPHLRRRHLRHEEGDREGEQRVHDGDRGGDADGPRDDRPVGRLRDERLEVVERERLLELLAESRRCSRTP